LAIFITLSVLEIFGGVSRIKHLIQVWIPTCLICNRYTVIAYTSRLRCVRLYLLFNFRL